MINMEDLSMKQINTDINIKYADIIKNIRDWQNQVNFDLKSGETFELKTKDIKKDIEGIINNLDNINSCKVSKLKLPRKLKKKFKKQSCYSFKIDVLLNDSICDSIEGKVTVE